MLGDSVGSSVGITVGIGVGGGGGGGGGGPPAGPPGPPGGPVAGPPFQSYAQLLQTQQATGEAGYADICTRLGMGATNQTARGAVRDIMHTLSRRVPTGAYLGFVEGVGGRLYGIILLQALEHRDLPQDQPSGADGRTLVQKGDVVFYGLMPMTEIMVLGDELMTRRGCDGVPTAAHFGTLANPDIVGGLAPVHPLVTELTNVVECLSMMPDDFDDLFAREPYLMVKILVNYTGRSGHPLACAIGPVARRIHYLKTEGAGPTMPLCAHKVNGDWMVITSTQVTNALRAAVALYGKPYNLTPDQVSARSLRSSGAMAMLCGGVDTARGRLQGRWKSDVMFRYLSVQHAPLCADIAQRMVTGGNFDTIPGAVNPQAPGAPTLLPGAATVAAHAAIVAAASAA